MKYATTDKIAFLIPSPLAPEGMWPPRILGHSVVEALQAFGGSLHREKHMECESAWADLTFISVNHLGWCIGGLEIGPWGLRENTT